MAELWDGLPTAQVRHGPGGVPQHRDILAALNDGDQGIEKRQVLLRGGCGGEIRSAETQKGERGEGEWQTVAREKAGAFTGLQRGGL